MSHIWLILVFTIHFVAFTFLYIKRKEKYYLFLMFSFSLLVVTNFFKLFEVQYQLYSYNFITLLTYVSRGLLVISLSYVLKRRVIDKYISKKQTA